MEERRRLVVIKEDSHNQHNKHNSHNILRNILRVDEKDRNCLALSFLFFVFS